MEAFQSEHQLLHEKCANKEFFLVRIQSECRKIRTRKKIRIWTLFRQSVMR